ncbi:MAG: TolC family protein [Acidobacteriota bacterium]
MARSTTALLVWLLSIHAAAAGLRLDEAVARAQDKNPALREQAALVESARAELKRSRILVPSDPTLEIEHETDGPFQGSGEKASGVRLSQELSLGKRSPRVAAAEASLQAAEAAYDHARRRLVRDVRAAFFDLLAAQRGLELAAETLKLNEDLTSAADARLKTGDISVLERDLALTELEAAKAGAHAAEMQRRRAEVALGRLMGGPGEKLSVEGEPPHLPAGLDEGQLLREAASSRLDLKARSAEVRAAEGQRDLARRGYIPDPEVSLFVTRERGVLAGDDFRGDPSVVSGIDLVTDEDVLAGVSVGIRLPVTGHVRAEIAARQAELEGRKAALEVATVDAAAELQSALAAAAEADTTVRIFEELAPRVEGNLKLLRKAYESGQISLADYLVQKDRSLAVRRALVEAQAAVGRALADLDLAAGQDLAFDKPGAP